MSTISNLKIASSLKTPSFETFLLLANYASCNEFGVIPTLSDVGHIPPLKRNVAAGPYSTE